MLVQRKALHLLRQELGKISKQIIYFHCFIKIQLFIRCAQKIVTQLETVSILRKKISKYEKLQQDEYQNELKINSEEWWSLNKENIDNRKNEITEKERKKATL